MGRDSQIIVSRPHGRRSRCGIVARQNQSRWKMNGGTRIIGVVAQAQYQPEV
jgi:hypothetical protein